MSNPRRVSGKSVAAFMFLPQFRHSFEGFHHIVPVFMRILGMMFVQAGLIPANHPATRYGVAGVEKSSFSRIMGDAWFTLRTTKASLQQWLSYLAVVFMIVMLTCSAISLFANVFVGVNNSAQAQIFSHPKSPYGAGDKTGKDQVESLAGGVVNPLFDTRYSLDPNSSSGASTDYALMVLDKVLRQGAYGAGGSTQNALRGLMEVYNTGVLVIAGIMVFWMITSIVIDTAKTGTLGGGRHNMVWAPIRIVFALGIMMPLGTTGFSSGQFMVMKLAEWGSNFGTRAWVKYVDGASDLKMVGPLNPKSVTSIANGITKIKLCQVAYNAHLVKSGTYDNDDSVIKIDTSKDRFEGKQTNYYTNAQGRALCGGITFAYTPQTTAPVLLGAMAAGGTLSPTGTAMLAVSIAQAISNLNYNAMLDETTDTQGIYKNATSFACAFAKRRTADGGNAGDNPVSKVAECASAGTLCGGSATADPTLACHQNMVNSILTQVKKVDAIVTEKVNAYAKTGLQAEMQNRGWGGMGLWYTHIGKLTNIANSMKLITAEITPGSQWSPKDMTDLAKDMRNIMGGYDVWWAKATTTAGANSGAPLTENDIKNKANTISGTGTGFKEDAANLEDSASADADGKTTASKLVGSLVPTDDEWFMFDVLGKGEKNVYPMAAVVAVGDSIAMTGAAMATIITVFQTVVGGLNICIEESVIVFGSTQCFSGSGIANSAIVNGLQSISMTLVICGIVVGFYLPILPMIRVAFAVLTWIISVFEAVCMVPIAALAHLSSEGDGLAGGAKTAWILWLNVLLRPVLVVLGFVGAMLVYNTFIIFFHAIFTEVASASVSFAANPIGWMISKLAYTVIYVAIMYTASNIIFKMLDTIPNALMRWMGGSPDQSFDHDNSEGMMIAGSNLMNSFKKGPSQEGKEDDSKKRKITLGGGKGKP